MSGPQHNSNKGEGPLVKESMILLLKIFHAWGGGQGAGQHLVVNREWGKIRAI